MVRLKVRDAQMKEVLHNRFNSNMVRLKVVRRGSILMVHYVFQFQYGTIKSFNREKEKVEFDKVSIPIWYD